MALAIDQTIQTSVLPTAPSLLLTLNKSASEQPNEAAATATSKGKMFSKDSPTISPINPITPPADASKQDLIALIAAMMVVIQAMEISIGKLMATASKCENSMMKDATQATVDSGKANVALAQKQYDDEQAAKRRSGIMKIFGYIAAALTCVVSVGTMTAVAALIVVAVTVVSMLGLLDDAVTSLLKKCGVDSDSTLGKWLSAAIKILIIAVLTMGTGAIAAAETAGSSTAEVAGNAAASGAEAGGSEAGIEMQELGQNAGKAAEDAEQEGAEAASDSSKASKASEAAKNPKMTAAKFAGKMQFAGTIGTLDPLGDLAIAIKRDAVGGKDDSTEGWIKMVAGIVEAILGMAAMFSAVQGEVNTAGLFSKMTDNVQTTTKIISALTKLNTAMAIATGGVSIDLGRIKLDQAGIEEDIAQNKAVNDELKTLVEMLQPIAQDQQKWSKQNSDLDKQLNDSFQYDGFSSFATVQLHG